MAISSRECTKCNRQFLFLDEGEKVNRKTRFWISFLFILLAYAFPLASAIYLHDVWMFTIVSAGFLFSTYIIYWLTIKKKEPKYPIVPPEGKPDVYMAARMPRPIYEDMEQHPWFFDKKRRLKTKKVKKKH